MTYCMKVKKEDLKKLDVFDLEYSPVDESIFFEERKIPNILDIEFDDVDEFNRAKQILSM